MNRTQSPSPLSARILLGLLASALVVPAAWAYVNGGDHHSTIHDYENKLHEQGWAVYVGEALPAKDSKEMVNGDLERRVNRMVGRTLRYLPEDKVDKIPLADKREVARIARETMRDFVQSKGPSKKEGQIGSLKYRVGVYSYETWWETNYGGKHRIHARQAHTASFVALQIVDER
jgi:hypothetical protein